MAKTILVTGANKGIGFEIARQLATLNHNVILTARDKLRGQTAVEKLREEDLHVNFLVLDVTHPEQREEVRRQVERDFGSLDVLVNNAGIIMRHDRELSYNNQDVWSDTLATNAEAPLKLSLVLAPLMPEGGRIINISSGGGSMTTAVGGWSPVYCISKSTLNAVTRHLAFHLSSGGILVNAACPGWVKTDLGSQGAPLTVQQGADTPVWLAIADNIPTGKCFQNRHEIPW